MVDIEERRPAYPGVEIAVRIAGPGETLPLAALLGAGRLIANAHAMGGVKPVEIRRKELRELLIAHPRVGLKAYQAV